MPRELYLSGLCKGNGIALGLTNGSTNFALDGLGSSGHPNLKPSEYGTNVGTQIGSISGNIAGAMGVTTDASKSGIIVERNFSKYLNFYIN